MSFALGGWRAGETIPASDSDDETGKGEGTLEGAHREREEWVLQRAASELGAGPMVVDVLASRLGAGPSAPLFTTRNSTDMCVGGDATNQLWRWVHDGLPWPALRLSSWHSSWCKQRQWLVGALDITATCPGAARRGAGTA